MTQAVGTTLDKYVCHPIHPEEVIQVWPLILPWVEEALLHGFGEYTSEDILQHIVEEYMYLMLCFHGTEIVACIVTEVHQYPQRKHLHVVIAGGKKPSKNYANFIAKKLDEGAARINADAITGYNFPAMARLIRQHGYEVRYTVVAKGLQNARTH